MMSDHEEEDLNMPDMNKVAYEVAIETICRMYKDIRKQGLGRHDTAAIVAAMIRMEDVPESDGDSNS